MQVHRGFYEGAKRHLEEIAQVVASADSAAGGRLPVWVTGHSLGGGYANALALHLLAGRATAGLFGAGGLHCKCSYNARGHIAEASSPHMGLLIGPMLAHDPRWPKLGDCCRGMPGGTQSLEPPHSANPHWRPRCDLGKEGFLLMRCHLCAPGGGTVTFGAPMVVYSERPQQLYAQLAAMERYAERSSRRNQPHQLQFHNLVPLCQYPLST